MSNNPLFDLEQYNAPSNVQKPQAEPLSARARRAQALVGTSPGRPKEDFYPTPEGATEALLQRVRFIHGKVWEPACGEGDLSRVLERNGLEVISTDLVNRGYGTAPVDFLKTETLLAPAIVTNPPFSLAEQFLKHALKLGASQVCLLGKLAFLEGQRRSRLLEESPLKYVLVFRNRLSLYRNGQAMVNNGMIAFAWYVWDAFYDGYPQIHWIESL